jgi:hypothetical protein
VTPNDFRSAFEVLVTGELPPALNDPYFIVRQIVRRDQRRTRVLAVLCLFFWLLGAAGMLVLVLGLNRLVIFLRIADGLPWSFNGPSDSISPAQEQLFWGTNMIHHAMPFIEVSIIALALAALFTVLLVFSSWKTTLNRINFSVAQIAEQLKQTSASGESVAAPAAPRIYQEKVRTGLWLVLVAVAALAVVCAIVFSTGRLSPADRVWQGYPRLSPFEAVRWQGQTPQVRLSQKWYELLAIDEVPVEQIISFSRSRGPDTWKKHFEEDLVELMIRMGHDPGVNATLKVKELPSGNVQILKDVPMTEANRMALWEAGQNEDDASGAGPSAAGRPIRGGERGMPFSAIRYHDEVPEVYVNGTWFELVAIDDMPAAQLIDFAKNWSARDDWQRRMQEDLGDMLASMNKPNKAVDLQLRALDTHSPVTLKNVPMTSENRVLNMFGAAPEFSGGTKSLFSAVRWQDDVPQVQINGNDTWYDLIGVDNDPIAGIIGFAKKTYGAETHSKIAGDAVEVIATMRAAAGEDRNYSSGAFLRLRTLDTHEEVTLLKCEF